MYHFSTRRIFFLVLTCSFVPGAVTAQLISLKTVPLATGDQFLIFPSENLPMGGVRLALDDPLLDPFVNPARGAAIGEPRMISAPTFYSISNRAGSARTLPVGAAFQSPDGWFGGVFAALQNLQRGDNFFGPVFFNDLAIVNSRIPPNNALSSRSATNKYANLSIGRTLGDGVAIGISGFFGDLGAMDGVEHLYATASGIAQRGGTTDLRLGLSMELDGGGKFQAVALHNRFDMDYDVLYEDWILVDSTTWDWRRQFRTENNQDKTRTWGAHVAYDQPVGENGWRVGGALTANRKTHPKIPNYEIMNIPRDPGFSNAFNIGVGIAKVTENMRFGLDLIYEPAASETWAEAAGPVVTASGDTIPDGGKTIENSFDFANAFINMGASHEVGVARIQLGLKVRAYDFQLDQFDNVLETSRRQDEDWMEWVPSWGLTIRFPDLELRYLGRVTTGTGRPGVAFNAAAGGRAELAGAAANDILLPPQGPLTLQDARVFTNQISISIPIR